MSILPRLTFITIIPLQGTIAGVRIFSSLSLPKSRPLIHKLVELLHTTSLSLPLSDAEVYARQLLLKRHGYPGVSRTLRLLRGVSHKRCPYW